MKISAKSTVKKPAQTARRAPAKAPEKKAAPASTGWNAGNSARKKADALIQLATKAVTKLVADRSHANGSHPALKQFGADLGMALGVIVTEALAVLPAANKPLRDAQGKPVKHIAGADRVGDHAILTRHQEVIGPRITALVKKLPAGVIHDLLQGFGEGATKAPGASYRFEAAVSDVVGKK